MVDWFHTPGWRINVVTCPVTYIVSNPLSMDGSRQISSQNQTTRLFWSHFASLSKKLSPGSIIFSKGICVYTHTLTHAFLDTVYYIHDNIGNFSGFPPLTFRPMSVSDGVWWVARSLLSLWPRVVVGPKNDGLTCLNRSWMVGQKPLSWCGDSSPLWHSPVTPSVESKRDNRI